MNGKPHGSGVFFWYEGRFDTGEYVHGVRQGRWVEACEESGPGGQASSPTPKSPAMKQGTRREGAYVDGKRHGPWVEACGDARWEGEYAAGAREGLWVRTLGDGRTEEARL